LLLNLQTLDTISSSHLAAIFIEVTCHCTTPLWQHSDLHPLSGTQEDIIASGGVCSTLYEPPSFGPDDEDESWGLLEAYCHFLMSRETFDDSLDHRITQVQDFIQALEY